MKKIWITVCMIVCTVLGIQAQNTSVKNVQIAISPEQDKVTISYDLERGKPTYAISVAITIDGQKIDARALTGDLGNAVVPGYGKRIVWDALRDVSELSGQLKVDVVAAGVGGSAGPCQPIKTAPAYAGIGGVAASGITLLVAGLGTKSEASKLYDVYKTNRDPDNAVYSELSRQDHYDEANGKHKKGLLLASAGGAILVGGGFVMVSRLIKINAYNKKCLGSTTSDNYKPALKVNPYVSLDGSAGATLTYTF